MKNYLDYTEITRKQKGYRSLVNQLYETQVYTVEIDDSLDIFSELPVDLFSDSYNEQVANVMNSFKKRYVQYVEENEITSVLPKLRFFIDEEESAIVQLSSSWNSGNASLYFAFEKEPVESSFGYVWNDDQTKNYETRSGNLYMNNTEQVIREILEFIFRVY